MKLQDLYELAGAAVCEGRNFWSDRHEMDWLEDDGPDPDAFVGGYVIDALFEQHPQLWDIFKIERPATE